METKLKLLRLLSTLHVGRRLAISVIVLLLPLTALGVFYIKSKVDAIQVARVKKDGLDYLAPLGQLMRHVAQHRGLTNVYLRGNQSVLPKARETAEQVDKALVQMESESDRSQVGLASYQQTSVLKSNWNRLKGEAYGLTPEESFARHTSLIKQALELNDAVAETTGLITEPTAEAYYLMDATILRGAALAEKIGQMRGWASGLVQKGVLEPSERVEAAARMASVNDNFQSIKRSLTAAYRYSDQLKRELDPTVQTTESKLRIFLGHVENLSRGETLKLSAPELFATGTDSLDEYNKLRDAADASFNQLLDASIDSLQRDQLFTFFLVVGVVSFGLFTAFITVQSVTVPVAHVTQVIGRIANGDNSARVGLDTKDEIGALSRQFDKMIEERVATQLAIQKENEQLNDSVLGLLQAVAKLSRKDLTVKVPVTEDVTGPVADALNLLSSETAKVLQEVSNISADVTAASLKVKEQSDKVRAVAEDEQREVEATAQTLAITADAMNRIAELAKTCNAAADNAIQTTQTALQTVNNTVGGINSIRDTIRETEKRIKRLGERSQEISGVVSLINTIAERTHILALNASMHAASAGEAGRGFAVVADEVQRLAENARQATAQIATLVNNIQAETADTVSAMNTAISQVVEGSKLAEQAGEQMKRTQETTSTLVASVQKIANTSQEQAKASGELLTRANAIQNSTKETSAKLQEQTAQTNNLVEYAKGLLTTVRVFKLPA